MENGIIEKNRRSKRINLITTIVLIICILLALFAFAAMFVEIGDNTFQFGTIDIKLGYYEGNKAKVFEETEYKPLFEEEHFASATDADTISSEKKFYVKNTGNQDAYYRIYLRKSFGNVDLGSLEHKGIEVTFGEYKSNGTKEAKFSGDASSFLLNEAGDNIEAFGELDGGEKKDLYMLVTAPEGVAGSFEFDICVEAVQKRNQSTPTDFLQ